jgi:hypothetical protein
MLLLSQVHCGTFDSWFRPSQVNPFLIDILLKSVDKVLEHGYLIMDYVDEGAMLSDSWNERCGDQVLRRNLFKGMSRIMLSLSQISLPHIGSWTIDDTGKLSLTNRPLLHQFHMAENESIPTGIPRSLTYWAADSFYADLLACHDSRIRNQPNSILNEKDGLDQIANLFAMRGLMPCFTTRERRHGPFVFTLTDLHASNVPNLASLTAVSSAATSASIATCSLTCFI